MVNATYGTATSTSSNVYIDTGLSATITPKFSTSKILVLVDMNGCLKNAISLAALNLRLLRGVTSIIQFTVDAGYTGAATTNDVGSCSTNYLDSPATTSATTYKVQMANDGNTGTVYINDGGNAGNSISSMTLLEIAA